MMKCLRIILILSTILSLLNAQTSNTCKILVLEGGLGDRSAYQAGVISGIVQTANPQDVQWDVISGIGFGAINGAGVSFFPKGQESQAAEFLVNTWSSITSYEDIYEDFTILGPAQSLFFHNGIYDTSPLQTYLNNSISQNTIQRELIVGVTNFETGAFEVFNTSSGNLNSETFGKILTASSSTPFLFQLNQVNGNYYTSGDLRFAMNAPSAINYCKSQGFALSDIIIDIILVYAKDISYADVSNYTTIDILGRTIDIFLYEVALRDVTDIKLLFPDVNIRYFASPDVSLFSSSPIDFEPSVIQSLIQSGISDGKSIVSNGVDFNTIHNDFLVKKYSRIVGKKVSLEDAKRYHNNFFNKIKNRINRKVKTNIK